MASNVIDSLFFELGLDTAKVEAALQKVDNFIGGAVDTVQGFAEGLQEGYSDAAQEVQHVAEAGSNAAAALGEMGDEGGKAAEDVANKIPLATREVGRLEKAARRAGHWLGNKLKGALQSTFAPMFALVAGGAIFGGYAKDMGRLAELSKKASLSAEELAEKQELMSTYSKEDAEVFARLEKQTDSLTKQMKRGAASILRVAVPAFEWLARKCQTFFNMVRDNKGWILGTLAAIALAIGIHLRSAITAALLPALKKMSLAVLANAKAWLSNPITWIAAAILALGLVLNDLWVYMHGGESALQGVWEKFGTGKELLDKFNAAVAWLGKLWNTVMGGLKSAAAVFFDYFGPAIDSVIGYFQNVFKGLWALLTGDFDGAFEHWKASIRNIADFIVNVLTGALRAVFDFFGISLSGLVDSVKKFGEKAKSWLPGWLGGGDTKGNWGGRDGGGAKGNWGGSEHAAALSAPLPPASLAVSPARAGASNSNVQTTINGGITIETQASDAKGISNEIGGKLEQRLTVLGNKGVR